MKVLHKLVIAGSLITPAAAIVLPDIASAHTANIEVSCQTGINVDLTNYHGTDHVTIWKDDNVIADADFSVEYHFHRGFTRTTSHTWRVKVAAGDEKSPDVSGTVPACVEVTTTSVATDVPPVPSTTTTLEPAVPTTPTTHPEIPCVLGPNGHYSFAGTDIPCEGPAPTTTTIVPVLAIDVPTTSVPPTDTPPSSLPATGSTSTPLIWLAIGSLGLGSLILLMRRLFPR